MFHHTTHNPDSALFKSSNDSAQHAFEQAIGAKAPDLAEVAEIAEQTSVAVGAYLFNDS